jgi:transposase
METARKTRPQGRPTKLTSAMRREFLGLVRAGMASTRAARALGVCPDTVTNWCRANPDFSEALEAAREESTGILEKQIHDAARKDWRAAAWLLERRLPDEYGRKDRLEARCAVSLETILEEIDSRPASDIPSRTEALPASSSLVMERPRDQIEFRDPITLEAIVDAIEAGKRGILSGTP